MSTNSWTAHGRRRSITHGPVKTRWYQLKATLTSLNQWPTYLEPRSLRKNFSRFPPACTGGISRVITGKRLLPLCTTSLLAGTPRPSFTDHRETGRRPLWCLPVLLSRREFSARQLFLLSYHFYRKSISLILSQYHFQGAILEVLAEKIRIFEFPKNLYVSKKNSLLKI